MMEFGERRATLQSMDGIPVNPGLACISSRRGLDERAAFSEAGVPHEAPITRPLRPQPREYGTSVLGHVLVNVRTSVLGERFSIIIGHCVGRSRVANASRTRPLPARGGQAFQTRKQTWAGRHGSFGIQLHVRKPDLYSVTSTVTDEVAATDTDTPNADVPRAAITAPVANPHAGRNGPESRAQGDRA